MSHIICMKKVFISFMGLLFLLISHAGAEETLEERKQRIMRKYLRERIDIVSSGLTVDTGEIDDESVKDSEMMQVEDLEFERHEGGVVMPPRQVPRPLPSQQENWWSETEVEELESSKGTSDYWSMFGVPREEQESDYRRSSETYEIPERRERKDIFGLRAPVENSEQESSFMSGSERVVNPWQSRKNSSSELLKPSYSSSRESFNSRYSRDPAEERRSFSPYRPANTAEQVRPSRNVMPAQPQEEIFVRPSYSPATPEQVQRYSPGVDNRDLQKFIEENR